MALIIEDKDQHFFEQAINAFEKAFEISYSDYSLSKKIEYSKKDAICHLFVAPKESIFKFLKWKEIATISKSKGKWNVNNYDIAKNMSDVLDVDIIYSKTMLVMKYNYSEYSDVSIDHPRFKG